MRRRILPIVVGASACYFGTGVLWPILPVYLVEDLHAGGTELGLVLGAFFFGALAGRLLAGWVTDRRAGGRPW